MKTLLLLVSFFVLTLTNAQEVTNASQTNKEIIPISALDIAPEYPGGMNAFTDYIMTEIKDYAQNHRGKVFIYFMIDSRGIVKDVEVKRTFNTEIGDRLAKIIEKSARWQPGIKNGKTVDTAFMLPINIDLVNTSK